MHIVILYYSEFDLNPASFFDTLPVNWPGKPAGKTSHIFEPLLDPYKAQLDGAASGEPEDRSPAPPCSAVGQPATPCVKSEGLDWLWCEAEQMDLEVNNQSNSAMPLWPISISHSLDARINGFGLRSWHPATGAIGGEPPLLHP